MLNKEKMMKLYQWVNEDHKLKSAQDISQVQSGKELYEDVVSQQDRYNKVKDEEYKLLYLNNCDKENNKFWGVIDFESETALRLANYLVCTDYQYNKLIEMLQSKKYRYHQMYALLDFRKNKLQHEVGQSVTAIEIQNSLNMSDYNELQATLCRLHQNIISKQEVAEFVASQCDIEKYLEYHKEHLCLNFYRTIIDSTYEFNSDGEIIDKTFNKEVQQNISEFFKYENHQIRSVRMKEVWKKRKANKVLMGV